MTLPTVAAQLAWAASNRSAHVALRRALEDPAAAQRRVLARLLRENSGCEFGRRHGFDRIDTPAAYAAAVPVRDYHAISDDIGRLLRGEKGVLTTGPVLMFEKTSGSTAAAKYIPYTASLRREFGAAIAAWMYDLHTKRPALLGGRAYWSVTPAAKARETTPGGHPVGFESDSEYLGTFGRALMRSIMMPGDDIARADGRVLHKDAGGRADPDPCNLETIDERTKLIRGSGWGRCNLRCRCRNRRRNGTRNCGYRHRIRRCRRRRGFNRSIGRRSWI